jgi:two-component system nitrate/nitrite response regulator NarL
MTRAPESGPTMKFLLIDDHVLFRRGLLHLLRNLTGEHTFLESETCEEAFALVSTQQDIDLILLDLALPGMNGLDGITRLRELCPTTPIVLLSANDNAQFVIEGIRRGAQGFIPKSANLEVISGALQVILAGGTYVPASGVLPDTAEPPGALTARQREVLTLLVENHSNKQIADALGMRVNTVRVHVAAILKILGVDNRVEAARAALSRGLITNGR